MNHFFKSKKELMMIAIAALCGLASIILIQQFIEPVPTIVANQNIAPGTVISESMLSVKKISKAFIYEDSIFPDQKDRIVGLPISVVLNKGAPVLWSHFRKKSIIKGMADVIEKGKRGLSVRFDPISAVSGFIDVNNKIDIDFAYKDRKTGGMFVKTILQNIQVLATGIRNRSTQGSLTLHLTPEEREILIFAHYRGHLYTSLRNNDDSEIIKTKAINFNEFMRFLGTLPVINERPVDLNPTPKKLYDKQLR